ncbi:hypothetical protein PC116_g23289 [Phytophthora cactorum]|nr:hypothetical protein PC116_g23289 [Phytophthora cactorum]
MHTGHALEKIATNTRSRCTHTCAGKGKRRRATCEWSKLAEIFHEFHVVFGLCSGTSGLDCRERPSVVGRFLGVAELGSLGFRSVSEICPLNAAWRYCFDWSSAIRDTIFSSSGAYSSRSTSSEMDACEFCDGIPSPSSPDAVGTTVAEVMPRTIYRQPGAVGCCYDQANLKRFNRV